LFVVAYDRGPAQPISREMITSFIIHGSDRSAPRPSVRRSMNPGSPSVGFAKTIFTAHYAEVVIAPRRIIRIMSAEGAENGDVHS
jgi:hypothetical protein